MAEYRYDTQSWQIPAGETLPTYIYVVDFQTNATNKVSSAFWIKMYNEGLLKPSGGTMYVADKFGLAPAPDPYVAPPPPEPTPPPPTPKPQYEIVFSTPFDVSTKMQTFASKLEGVSGYGWGIIAVNKINNNQLQIIIEEQGSISIGLIVALIAAIFIVVIGLITSTTVKRLSDNQVVVDDVDYRKALLDARTNDKITEAEYQAASEQYYQTGWTGGTGGTGGDWLGDIQTIVPMILLVMLIGNVRMRD